MISSFSSEQSAFCFLMLLKEPCTDAQGATGAGLAWLGYSHSPSPAQITCGQARASALKENMNCQDGD